MLFQDYLLVFIGGLMLVVGILIGVSYLTLLERKILSYIQVRKGPNKLGFMGILQPFADGIKLFTKEVIFPFSSNYLIYYISPVISFIMSLLIWMVFPFSFNFFFFSLGMMFFFCCTSVGVYTVMLSGWSSNSIYAMLGSMRAVAQTISYEVSMILIFISCLILVMDFNLINFFIYQDKGWFIYIMLPLGLCMFSSMLAETNRSPFDFAEGESELVSGFNIEYGAGGFALIFLAEYSSILFMGVIFSLIYLGGYSLNLMFYLKILVLSYFFIWVRGTLPRYRYDKLMNLAWKVYLPLSLNYFMFFLLVSVYML